MKDLIPVKFNEEVVITTKMLANVYGCDEKVIILKEIKVNLLKVNIISNCKVKNCNHLKGVVKMTKALNMYPYYIYGLKEVRVDIAKC